jgi:hypothetical protein
MKPRQHFRDYSAQQNPEFHAGDYVSIPTQKIAHAKLMRIIAGGQHVEHNGVLVPTWAIPSQVKGEGEAPTIWSQPIAELVRGSN